MRSFRLCLPQRKRRREGEPISRRRLGVFRGTDGSNPVPSTGESSANRTSSHSRYVSDFCVPGRLSHCSGPGSRSPLGIGRQRTSVRAAMAQDTALAQLPGGGDLIAAMESEIMNPAPFMRPLGSRDYGTGNVYEMRTYTYAPGDIPKVLEAWAKAVPAREELSPLAACWTSELGGLNKFVHTWVYKDLGERARIREESRKPGGAWPPQSGVRPVRQENKLLVPTAFSPVR
jgi:hypothetical protein